MPRPLSLYLSGMIEYSFSKGYGIGSELIRVIKEGQQWRTETIWKKTWMKTKMCNVVICDRFVYGLDGENLQCIGLDTGKKQWTKRRQPSFGHGQMMLFDDVILLITESGELLLVEATPEKYRELAAIRALQADQVTWNNPAFSSPYLLVRNAEEAVCYRFPLIVSSSKAISHRVERFREHVALWRPFTSLRHHASLRYPACK